MKKSNYLKNIKLEIENIKKFIPLENRLRLNFKLFNPESQEECIYGLIYGDCFTKEAETMIRKCCIAKSSFDELTDNKPVKVKVRSKNYDTTFSYLEHYIFNNPDQNEDIIKYLREEINQLVI